jgi:hypothetical protein
MTLIENRGAAGGQQGRDKKRLTVKTTRPAVKAEGIELFEQIVIWKKRSSVEQLSSDEESRGGGQDSACLIFWDRH